MGVNEDKPYKTPLWSKKLMGWHYRTCVKWAYLVFGFPLTEPIVKCKVSDYLPEYPKGD
jgi:hypothetical protein